MRWLFLRAIGLVSFAAWTSLSRQVLGLYGAKGLQPLAPRLDALKARTGRDRAWRIPTVFWWGASDGRLLLTCRVGQCSSLLLAANLLPRPAALTSWLSYLSFTSVGQPFLPYQWDALLLEAGLLSALFTPGGVRPGLGRTQPTLASDFMLRWLAFRLHFESGLAKLQSHDRTWRELTACGFHQETQPLPTPAGWYVHHLPARVQKAATLSVLAAEVLVPPLALLPGPFRRAAFWSFLGLQSAIQLTGNYGFFNLLTVAISLNLLDDRALPLRSPNLRRAPLWRQLAEGALAAPLWVASAHELYGRFRSHRCSRPMSGLTRTSRRLQLTSPYGLFAAMTTTRPELVIEGSMDGERWREYRFRYKPVDPSRRPRFVGPHMPRLDWQMWFAALGAIDSWLLVLVQRLLEGAPEVRRLLGEDPFGGAAPTYARVRLYDYRMTKVHERRGGGRWWRRELKGDLFPPMALQQGARVKPRPPASPGPSR